MPCALALLLPGVGVARAVGLACAVAASTFCPLLVLGIWWRGLTRAGALAGLLVGGGRSGAAVLWNLATPPGESWGAVLLEQPAAWSVPAALLTMTAVSLATRSSLPPDVHRFMVRLHTREQVQLDRG